MQALYRDWEKLSSKASDNHNEISHGLEQVVGQLELLKQQLGRDGHYAIQQGLDPVLFQFKSTATSALQLQKEYHALYSKWQRAVDKKFNQTVLPLLGGQSTSNSSQSTKPKLPFTSDSARQALKRVIVSHLLRQGRFETATIFSEEAECPLSSEELQACQDLYHITNLIQNGDLSPALRWAESNRDWLESHESPLEFDLRRSEFVRILTQLDFDHIASQECPEAVEMDQIGDEDTMMESVTFDLLDSKEGCPMVSQDGLRPGGPSAKQPLDCPVDYAHDEARKRALAYARRHFPRFFPKRWDESVKLTTSVLFIPLSNLKNSPYAEYFTPGPNEGDQPWVHAHHLVPLFTKEYCARMEWSKELPLKVATDLGSGGALAKIAKVRSVMKEKRTEWSQADELPVEIPLPHEYRFHSVFACPVSKEQSTETNPPMMMPCGHVIAKESMQKLAKGGGTVKCPYCPSSASMSSAIQVYF